ncbi:hypothetical protein Vadar_017307 [Vaccinium darrowii]|uniref:Uncharacterized protein n=1 Tax=Vaccinium darrowii TaxID=229202 RepID=A0ACB7XIV4_9ERIC|nr:hypothetical protein Vadar_017307 [Vaccinium darrowii]
MAISTNALPNYQGWDIIAAANVSVGTDFFGSRKTNVFDPFSLDVWDPFDGFFTPVITNAPASAHETSQANARIDWKETLEAHVFKADLSGLKKEEVKVEVEKGRILQINGERSSEEEKNGRIMDFRGPKQSPSR